MAKNPPECYVICTTTVGSFVICYLAYRVLFTLKVEKFACTNFRENKISRGLIFATEDFDYFALTYFREFRE